MTDSVHSVTVTDRDITLVTAVRDIISFDDTQIILSVDENTNLSISGTDLSLKRLSIEAGQVDINGRVDAVVYVETGAVKKRRRLFG